MNAKFSQSWQLFKASIAITLRNRKLLWFPVLSAFMTVLMALCFLAPWVLPEALHPTGYHLDQKEHWVALQKYYFPVSHTKPESRDSAAVATEALGHLLTGYRTTDSSEHAAAGQTTPLAHEFLWSSHFGWLYWLAVYFFSMFMATFFNVAFYSEIIAALNGRGISLRRGLTLACSRWPSILAWTLLAGVVGWIIHKIQERLPFVGRIVTGLIGLAWSVASVFVIPVIIQEQPTRNPIKILQQSALTLKRTWGEGVIGYLGFSAGSAVVFLCSLVPLLLAGGVALLLKSVWFMAVAGVIWVIGLLCMAYVSGVASHVYRCALYIYAAEGVVPEPFNRDWLDMAWKVKKS